MPACSSFISDAQHTPQHSSLFYSAALECAMFLKSVFQLMIILFNILSCNTMCTIPLGPAAGTAAAAPQLRHNNQQQQLTACVVQQRAQQASMVCSGPHFLFPFSPHRISVLIKHRSEQNPCPFSPSHHTSLLLSSQLACVTVCVRTTATQHV